MCDFECSSDSTSSAGKESNDLFNISKQNSDHDSDSTIIIDENLDSIDECTRQRTFSGKKLASFGTPINKNGTNNFTNYQSTNKMTYLDDNVVHLNKPATSNYCKVNTSSYCSNDRIDPELESILLKYASPPLDLAGTNRNRRPEGIATSTFTSDEKNELIELSSDEDEDFPQIQIKNAHKPTSTVINSQVAMGVIDVDNRELSKKHKSTFHKTDNDLPQFQFQLENKLGSITFERDMVDVDNEKLSNEDYTQNSDEDLPWINIKNRKETSSMATERDNEDILNKYNTIFDGSGVINTVTSSINKKKKEDSADLYKSPKKKRKLNSEENSTKISKTALQAKKREDAEKAKKVKQALLAANKNMKPEECMKFMTVLLDSEIATEQYGGDVLNALQAANITYRLQSQLIPYTVTWKRKVETHIMDKDEELRATSDTVETTDVLLILMWKQVAELVHSRSLVTHVKSLQSILANKKLTLAIYGMENYFKYQKSKKQREVRSEITLTSQKTNNKYDKIYKDVAKISKKQFEYVVTELQLLCGCCHRMVETALDLGAMIVQFSKAIAQAPYKTEKQRKQQEEEWYISGDNKDCVQVDKNGNGLQRLWQQQLTTFPLARLEHAEAIVAKYSTPTSLMEDYSHCTPTEGEKLLQDIPIRRAAGPLTTVRKIGPELSKKIYKFFSSTDGDVVL